MRPLWRTYPWALFAAVTAQIVAAALVFYLQFLLADQQKAETSAILGQICTSTAVNLAGRVRQHLDGALMEVVEEIGAPELKAYNIQRAVTYFNQGLRKFQYVDSFFLWSDQYPSHVIDQVLFVTRSDRQSSERIIIDKGKNAQLISIPHRSRALFAIAMESSTAHKIYTMMDREIDGEKYEIAMHLYWTDILRTSLYAIVGYAVNLDRVHGTVFEDLMRSDLASALNPQQTLPRLHLTVQNELGHVMYGEPILPGSPSASAPVDFRFFPAVPLKSYLMTPVQFRPWSVTVSAPVRSDTWSVTQHWISAIAALLIVTVIICAISSVKQARRLWHMQSDFVANVSHQLKTPLSVLAGASETLHLNRTRSPEKLKEYTQLVRTQTVRLSKLVDQILTFSRSEMGDVSSMQPVEMNALVKRCVDDFERDLRSGRCEIKLELSDESLLVQGDPDALEQVLVNLVDNAVKYGKTDSLNEIVVRVKAQGVNVILSVLDHGVGIESAERAHIFDKFYRGEQVRDQTRGFGLGLTIVQTVISAHGGRVSVSSEPGAGTEFCVCLPKA